jgi:hypothetical protein
MLDQQFRNCLDLASHTRLDMGLSSGENISLFLALEGLEDDCSGISA